MNNIIIQFFTKGSNLIRIQCTKCFKWQHAICYQHLIDTTQQLNEWITLNQHTCYKCVFDVIKSFQFLFYKY